MNAPAQYWPGATAELVAYRGEAPLFTLAPLGWLLHVQDGNGDPGPWFDRLVSPDRAFSHLWVAKSGQARQYQTFDRQAWAAMAGNERYWQVETEGHPGEALTGAQLDTLRGFHQWSGTANQLAGGPGQAGIGYHSMGADWGHPQCPGSIRIGQRAQILTPAPAPAPAPVPGPPAARSRLLMLTWPYLSGTDVRSVQARVGAAVDGVYGPATRAAVVAFQYRYWPRWPAMWDGIVGPATARALGIAWVA